MFSLTRIGHIDYMSVINIKIKIINKKPFILTSNQLIEDHGTYD